MALSSRVSSEGGWLGLTPHGKTMIEKLYQYRTVCISCLPLFGSIWVTMYFGAKETAEPVWCHWGAVVGTISLATFCLVARMTLKSHHTVHLLFCVIFGVVPVILAVPDAKSNFSVAQVLTRRSIRCLHFAVMQYVSIGDISWRLLLLPAPGAILYLCLVVAIGGAAHDESQTRSLFFQSIVHFFVSHVILLLAIAATFKLYGKVLRKFCTRKVAPSLVEASVVPQPTDSLTPTDSTCDGCDQASNISSMTACDVIRLEEDLPNGPCVTKLVDDQECLSSCTSPVPSLLCASIDDSLWMSTTSVVTSESSNAGSTDCPTQTNLTWNGCILTCSACAKPPVPHTSLNGAWQLCPIPAGTPSWMHQLLIKGSDFMDASRNIGKLKELDGQLYLEGGRLCLLPNGMLQRNSRSSGVTITYVRVSNTDFSSAADGVGILHNIKHATINCINLQENCSDTQTPWYDSYFCICASPSFNAFNGIWDCLAIGKKIPGAMRHLQIHGTVVYDAHGQRLLARVLGDAALKLEDGILEHDDAGGIVFSSPRHHLSYRKSLREESLRGGSTLCATVSHPLEELSSHERPKSASLSSHGWCGGEREMETRTTTCCDLDLFVHALDEEGRWNGDSECDSVDNALAVERVSSTTDLSLLDYFD